MKEETQDYYVYVHRRKDNDEVFYVGSGTGNRFRSKSNRSKDWYSLYNSCGFVPEIIIRNLTEKESRSIETDFIIHYGSSVVNKLLPVEVIEVSKDYLDSLYYYDESSSTYLRHKLNTNPINPKHRRGIGDEAGYFEYRGDSKHRIRVTTPEGKALAAHRIVYILHHGVIPEGLVIDHIDGDPFNNNISNLRAVTRRINSRNTKLSSSNKLGVKGVILRKIGNYDVFVAAWRENNKSVSKAFYVCKYGYEEALRLAIKTRSDKLAELQGFTERGHFKE